MKKNIFTKFILMYGIICANVEFLTYATSEFGNVGVEVKDIKSLEVLTKIKAILIAIIAKINRIISNQPEIAATVPKKEEGTSSKSRKDKTTAQLQSLAQNKPGLAQEATVTALNISAVKEALKTIGTLSVDNAQLDTLFKEIAKFVENSNYRAARQKGADLLTLISGPVSDPAIESVRLLVEQLLVQYNKFIELAAAVPL